MDISESEFDQIDAAIGADAVDVVGETRAWIHTGKEPESHHRPA